MDVSLFKPINLHITSVTNNGYVISWDVGAVATSAITSEEYFPQFIVYGRDAISGIIAELGRTSSTTVNLIYFVHSGISEVYVTALLDSSESLASDSVTTVSTNIMPDTKSIAVGRDERGNARALAVTEDGVLKVTGVTVNNYGGDASAANQAVEITKLDGIKASTDAVKASTDAISTGLGSVGLDAPTVAALQLTTVSNFPSNYPDVDTTAAINAASVVAAKEVTLNNIKINTTGLLKTTDLSITMGVLDTNVTNLPTDFPDVGVLAELSAQAAPITATAAHVDAISNTADAILTVAGNNAGHNSNLVTLTTNIDATLANSNTTLDDISIHTASTTLNTHGTLTGVAALNVAAASVLKTSDLDLHLGVLTVKESVPVTDFPDAGAHSRLEAIDASVQALAGGQAITFNESLPAGSNVIGHVLVDSTVLATNAATEATLLNTVSKIGTSNTLLNAVRLEAINLGQKVDALSQIISDKDQVVICDENIINTATTQFRPEAIIDPTLLTSFSKYVIQVFSYASPGTVNIYKESAVDSTTYYHALPEYKNMALFAGTIIEREFTLVRNIMIQITNPGTFKIRITGIK